MFFYQHQQCTPNLLIWWWNASCYLLWHSISIWLFFHLVLLKPLLLSCLIKLVSPTKSLRLAPFSSLQLYVVMSVILDSFFVFPLYFQVWVITFSSVTLKAAHKLMKARIAVFLAHMFKTYLTQLIFWWVFSMNIQMSMFHKQDHTILDVLLPIF